MKNKIFQFGEKVKGYSIHVLNEREVRAASGILLLFALIGFFKAVGLGSFTFIKTFAVIFLIDFIIRVFINPKYSPSLIIGRFFVKNQTPEYVGAPQKKFAWIIGLTLVSIMIVQLVILNYVSILTFIVCLFCLTFLFFESIFGICIGCKVYELFPNNKSELCPGGVCEERKKEKIQLINYKQTIIVILFFILIFAIIFSGIINTSNPRAITKAKYTSTSTTDNYFSGNTINNQSNNLSSNSSSCIVPQWAKDIGHEKLYKEHHGCELFN